MRKRTAIAFLVLLTSCSDGDDADRPDVTAATLNILHGIFCPSETEDCRVEDRVDLLFDWVESTDCPDVVTLQEVLGARAVGLVEDRVARRCPFTYQIHEPPGLGQNVTLSRYPVEATHLDRLLGGIRGLWHTHIAHPTGPLDVFNTHLAAGVDNGSSPCAAPCPAECTAQGAVTNRDCQAVQVARFARERSTPGSLRILAGDFNATPDTFVYRHLIEQGWTDAYIEAGGTECDPSSGMGCTSGRESEDLGEMESPAPGVRRRIDFLFIQDATGEERAFELDSIHDDDGDGLATRLFTDDPNPFAAECGARPAPICWPSDHEGVQADLNCRGRCEG